MQQGPATGSPGFRITFLVFKRCDKNDGNFCPHFNEAMAEVESGHPAQLDVQHQAMDRLSGDGLQEGLGRGVNRSAKTNRPQQSPDCPAKAFVVIHHRDMDFLFIHLNRT